MILPDVAEEESERGEEVLTQIKLLHALQASHFTVICHKRVFL